MSANLDELEAAIERLQATVAVLKFVEKRLPDRGTNADLAALNGLRVAQERLTTVATQLGSFALSERQVYTEGRPSTSPEPDATGDRQAADSKAVANAA